MTGQKALEYVSRKIFGRWSHGSVEGHPEISVTMELDKEAYRETSCVLPLVSMSIIVDGVVDKKAYRETSCVLPLVSMSIIIDGVVNTGA